MSEYNMAKLFLELKQNKNTHLGLWDVRITVAIQDEIEKAFETIRTEKEQLTAKLKEYRHKIMELNVDNEAMRNVMKMIFDRLDDTDGLRCSLAKWVK